MKKVALKLSMIGVFVLILFATFSIMVSAANRFDDVSDGHWAEDEICFCYYRDTLYASSTYFYPTNGLTRAEAIKGITDILDLNIPKYANTDFTDVPYSSEYSGAIKWASDNNVAEGTGNNLFSPNNIVSRQAFCTFLYRACIAQNITLPVTVNTVSFNDNSSIASWALPAVTAMAKAEMVVGYSNGNFGPTDTITRAAGATILARLYSIANYPGNEILFYIRTPAGAPISNAAVYVYYTNEDPRYDKYPESPVYTNAHGVACLPSTNNLPYVANVFASGYRQGVSDADLVRSNFFKSVEMIVDNNNNYAVPIAGFSKNNEWSSITNYLNSCRNFGWRYGVDNNYEYHQGIDIARVKGTSVQSSSPGTVTMSTYLSGCGEIVQIKTDFLDNSKSYYFIYQHLNSRLVSGNSEVIREQNIGTVGNTGGNYGYHLHYSISTSSEYGLNSRMYMDPFAHLISHSPYYN